MPEASRVLELSERELKHLNRSDPVRRHTRPAIREQVDRELLVRLRRIPTEPPGAIDRRIGQLEREWDLDRAVAAGTAAASLLGLVLALGHRAEWVALPLFTTAFGLLQATVGWSPPVPVLRRLGLRTRKEIDVEKFALKALRGDFEPRAAPGLGSTAG
ncbi:MAG TPA: hypothetical protein VNK43_04680 [Gemmatimonadales bacterium]|nr:hypothetical protein [Gemmatimonadales bacterium]